MTRISVDEVIGNTVGSTVRTGLDGSVGFGIEELVVIDIWIVDNTILPYSCKEKFISL